jgi:hypothetical protein
MSSVKLDAKEQPLDAADEVPAEVKEAVKTVAVWGAKSFFVCLSKKAKGENDAKKPGKKPKAHFDGDHTVQRVFSDRRKKKDRQVRSERGLTLQRELLKTVRYLS